MNNNQLSSNKIITLCLLLLIIVFFQKPLLSQNSSTDARSNVNLNDKEEPNRYSSIATIQILNKTTAKNTIIDLKIGQKIKIGTITINAKKCWQAPIDQKPESKILIEVLEEKSSTNLEDVKLNRIFYGWLFASSPSISGLEHPIYDIVAINCK